MQRQTLALLAGVVVVGGLAVGAFALTSLGGGPSAADQVPSDVDMVVKVDGDVTTDQVTRELLNASYQGTAVAVGAPLDADDALSEFENETGLDPEGFEEGVVFGSMPDLSLVSTTQEEYSGFVFHANWDTDAVVELIREDASVELEETTYNGATVYRPVEEPEFGTASTFAVLGDGQFVGGSEQVVEDVVDVANGDADAFGGDLRSAYEDAPDGLLQYAVRVPTEQLPQQGGGAGPDVSEFRGVNVIAGSYYTTGNSAGVETRLIADSEADAQDVQDVVDGGISLLTGFAQDEEAQSHLREIEVQRNGATVVVSYEQSVDSLRDLIEYYQNQGTGAVGA